MATSQEEVNNLRKQVQLMNEEMTKNVRKQNSSENAYKKMEQKVVHYEETIRTMEGKQVCDSYCHFSGWQSWHWSEWNQW